MIQAKSSLAVLILPVFLLVTTGCMADKVLKSTTASGMTAPVKNPSPKKASSGMDKTDPWEFYNRKADTFNNTLDRALISPVATGYIKVTPRPLRNNISNFFSNIAYVNVMVNNFLQLKIQRGLTDLLRVAVNTTMGFLGVFDAASAMGLEKYDESWSQTLAYWGVPLGPYFVVPLFGPNTLLTTIDIPLNYLSNPVNHFTALDGYQLAMSGAKIIDKRASLQKAIEMRDKLAIDPYLFTREAYLQNFKFRVNDGVTMENDPFLEEMQEIIDETSH